MNDTIDMLHETINVFFSECRTNWSSGSRDRRRLALGPSQRVEDVHLLFVSLLVASVYTMMDLTDKTAFHA